MKYVSGDKNLKNKDRIRNTIPIKFYSTQVFIGINENKDQREIIK